MAGLNTSIDLPLGEAAPRVARAALRAVLIGWGFADPGWLERAGLVVTELVSNAVRHGGGCLELLVAEHGGRVTVSAADGSGVLPRRSESDGGRGLILIEAMAEAWGVEDYQGGKRVWVRLMDGLRQEPGSVTPGPQPGQL